MYLVSIIVKPAPVREPDPFRPDDWEKVGVAYLTPYVSGNGVRPQLVGFICGEEFILRGHKGGILWAGSFYEIAALSDAIPMEAAVRRIFHRHMGWQNK